jgi:hypothetical protein
VATFGGLLGLFHIWLEEPNFMLPMSVLLAVAVAPSLAPRDDGRVPGATARFSAR